ncbi:hypothetical protein B484DRAFT_448547 [Ochromonadaceae sp. CCMP2298]|nr:hypothetical protein B484DRAFT_448547 [Ochromonadaceae sp. CCMP2298]
MFGRNDALPVHGGSQHSNGISGVPVVNKSVALSLAWVVGSIIVFVLGVWHMRSSAFSYTLKCSKTDCVYTAFEGQMSKASYAFPKSDLLEAELGRLDSDGSLQDAEAARKQPSSRGGYTIRLKARLPVGEGSSMKAEKAFAFSPQDMGRRKARAGATSITRYIHMPAVADVDDEKEEKLPSKKAKRGKKRGRQAKEDELDLSNRKSISAMGLLSCFAALLSLTLACLFGTWSEKTRRTRLKKAS